MGKLLSLLLRAKARWAAVEDRRNHQRPTSARTVRHDDFVRHAPEVMRDAKRNGPLGITNANGAPRMVICIPRNVRAVQ